MQQRMQLDDSALELVTGGVNTRTKFVSAFYCEYCRQTVHLNGVYALEKAKKEHNAKYHPQIKK